MLCSLPLVTSRIQLLPALSLALVDRHGLPGVRFAAGNIRHASRSILGIMAQQPTGDALCASDIVRRYYCHDKGDYRLSTTCCHVSSLDLPVDSGGDCPLLDR